MDCQRAVYVLSGSEQVLNEAGWTGSDESTWCCSIALNPKKPVWGEKMQKDDWRWGLGSIPLTSLDTQSSLKQITVYAVLEDSHYGGPVLLERPMLQMRHTLTSTHTRKHLRSSVFRTLRNPQAHTSTLKVEFGLFDVMQSRSELWVSYLQQKSQFGEPKRNHFFFPVTSCYYCSFPMSTCCT